MRVSCDKAKMLVLRGAQLLDVRSGPEFKEDGLPGAINIPLPMLVKYAALLERDKPVVIYCRSGNRSAKALNMLKVAGFKQVFDLGARSNF
jgi:phage shock protein E